MAARVGTGVTGTADSAATSIASAAKNTTTGNLLVAIVKWEEVNLTVTGLTDTAGNSWQIAGQILYGATSEPGCALCYAKNITGNASNIVTANFSGSALYRRIIVEEFSGLETGSIEDGTEQTNSNTGTTYSTSAISTSSAGLVVFGVGAYGALSSITGAGTPTFSIGADAGDCFLSYYISGSAQSVTPGASATGGGDRFAAVAQAFKDATVASARQHLKFNLLGVG